MLAAPLQALFARPQSGCAWADTPAPSCYFPPPLWPTPLLHCTIIPFSGVSKSELLDREAGDLAVRMALGETHVIAETKRALGDAGGLGCAGDAGWAGEESADDA